MAERTWLDDLDAKKRLEAEVKISMMKHLGSKEAEEWIKSEIKENIPQFARFLILKSIWPELIDQWRTQPGWIKSMIVSSEKQPKGYFSDAGAALKQMLDVGVSETDITNLARFLAYETAFGVLSIIDDGADVEASDEAPKWILMEVGQENELTGRVIQGLNESLLSLDPSGREGKPS